ncbi:MAG: YrdB family protein [Chloroflexota bacterium]|nr:YrdB family protein [Chloroflexota bacterium]
MNDHPINLALRFLLELAALGALGYWGWTTHEGIWRLVWAVGLPLVAAILWGTFRVPGDPGHAPVPVPGPVRLLLELAFFGSAVWLLTVADRSLVALILGVLVTLHYLVSYDRIIWLLTKM